MAKFVEVVEMVQVADICSPGLVVKLVNKVAESIVIRRSRSNGESNS